MSHKDELNLSRILGLDLTKPPTDFDLSLQRAELISLNSLTGPSAENTDIEEAGLRAALHLRNALRDADQRQRLVGRLSPTSDRHAGAAELQTIMQQVFARAQPMPDVSQKLDMIEFLPAMTQVPPQSNRSGERLKKFQPLAGVVFEPDQISVLIDHDIGFRELQLTALRSVVTILAWKCIQTGVAPIDCDPVSHILNVVDPELDYTRPPGVVNWPQRIDVVLTGRRTQAILADFRI